ncbi:ribosomal RNA small subunit methyltransferase B [Mycoavidus sp. B2-EB]|nr:16S rRNA (cytosine(967)-C(5))-methyltransferase RsmB [Mycoavidus sp. B2-EB]BBO60517.1 ribosomal RNA small subunit methyltransferase B [Mycoavidus sp. B2-EB]
MPVTQTTSHFAMQPAPDSLAFALNNAARALAVVRAGTALPAALTALFAEIEVPAARGAIQDIAYRTLRALGRADALLAALVRKPPTAPVANLLTCALALLSDEPDAAIYAPFTVVDQAVCAASVQPETHPMKGFVNAVLRNFLRSRATLLAQIMRNPVARWNHPRWWIDEVRAAWPTAWEGILSAGNTHAPLTLRVNQRRSTVAEYLDVLHTAQIPAVAAGPSAVRLLRALPVERVPGFMQGVVSVQDASAQRAAPLLEVRPGMRVLDACAAPGGKTGHLLELAEIDLVALEVDQARAMRIKQNLDRLQLVATVCIGSASSPEQWWDGQLFDRVLIDAPCSGSGIVRRHPDIRWLRRSTDLTALAREQQRMLAALWPLLKPGGELVYATCSIFPIEGEGQAQWFEGKQQDAVRLSAPGQILPSTALPDAGSNIEDRDGFFYARFRKQ